VSRVCVEVGQPKASCYRDTVSLGLAVLPPCPIAMPAALLTLKPATAAQVRAIVKARELADKLRIDIKG
jgi:hypothetical protein